MSEKIFVLTDIHGCASEFKLLLNKLPLTPGDSIIFFGDYIDRGPLSKDVIDTILKLKKNYKVTTLKGNHEQMFLDFIDDPSSEAGASFLYNGGTSTLASYTDKGDHYHFPEEHIDFFRSLKLYHETEDFFCVHAGLPDIKIDEIDEELHEMDILWIRDSFHNSSFDWGKLIIHGHSPVSMVEDSTKRINIDTGLVYNGNLTALQLPEKKLYSVARQVGKRHVFLKDPGSVREATRFQGVVSVYLYKVDEILQFETVDYCEFGLYVRDVVNDTKQVLEIDQKFYGALGRDDYKTVSFEALVLRCDKKTGGIYYALQLNKTPYDFIEEQDTKNM